MTSPDPPCLLSVEDNADTRDLLHHLLKDSYEVKFASGAEEALRCVESEPIDLLLVDINLGTGKKGTELLRIVREREDLPDVPAVALTAYAMPGDREDLLAKGFDAYQKKPFAKQDLMAKIERALAAAEGEE